MLKKPKNKKLDFWKKISRTVSKISQKSPNLKKRDPVPNFVHIVKSTHGNNKKKRLGNFFL